MAVVTSEVIHIVEPFAEILYGGKALGNVDTRFGDAESVQANRDRMLAYLKPERYVLQIVQLGPEFTDLSDIPTDELEGTYLTDGLIIDRPGIAMGLNPADCNAIGMIDARHGRAAGMIHGGRQGVDGDIHLAALAHMTDPGGRHGIPKEDLRLHFAPSIRKDSYHYPTISPKQLADPRWKRFIERREGNYHIDLLGRIVKDLADAGIDPETQMEISPIDVGADPGFFSHVRSGRSKDEHGVMQEPIGRNAVVAMLRHQAV